MHKLLLGSLICCVLQTNALAAPSGDDDAKLTPEAMERIELSIPVKNLVRSLGQAKQVVGEQASGLVERAMGFLGVPYKRGGTSAETGFDCSGFVRAIYEQTVGLLLPHRASEQADTTQIIDKSELKPGDLVFFNTMKRAFSHVGIYVGDGKFIHAPRAGTTVRVEDMRIAYWEQRFNGARRVQVPADQRNR